MSTRSLICQWVGEKYKTIYREGDIFNSSEFEILKKSPMPKLKIEKDGDFFVVSDETFRYGDYYATRKEAEKQLKESIEIEKNDRSN